MKINGVNRKFKLTIGAVAEISAICPDGDIDRMTELFETNDIGQILESTAKVAIAMNKYADITAEPLTVDEIFALDMQGFKELQDELVSAYRGDSIPTVNAKSKKKGAESN